MELLNRILNCSEEELDSIISEAINEANNKSPKVDRLGFLNFDLVSPYCGFIPLDTRIKYATNNLEDYGMQTTDFIYEFAHYIRSGKLDNDRKIIYRLERFINKYFGYSNVDRRQEILNDKAWNSTTTDEEYFAALEQNKLGDLKGQNVAMCTERGALAQQILSLLGYETYYCMGCINIHGKEEAHCFNIIKRENDYLLLDYSAVVCGYNQDGTVKDYYPFIGVLSNEDFLEFLDSGIIKSFRNYYFTDSQCVTDNTVRSYIVGKYTMQQESNIAM